MNGWQSAYLRSVGIPPTPDAAGRLSQWQVFEGGATHNNAAHNYLNTTERMPGSQSINSVGVQRYSNLGQGAMAFAKTIKGNPAYANLVTWIKTGQGDPSAALQVWVSGKPDGNPEYARKVLGHAATAPAGVTGAQERVQALGGGLSPSAPSVRETAAQGFAAIAQGKADPSETFGTLIASLHAQSAPGAAGGGTQPAQPTVVIPPGLKGLEAQAAKLVQKYLGVQYQWGGTTPAGFDCSGLVQYIYRSLGVNVPRTTYEQWDKGVPVKDLRPGDAVFFTGSDPMNGKPGHEGMYVGNGLFIEAPHSGAQVRVSKLSGRTDFVGARRFAG